MRNILVLTVFAALTANLSNAEVLEHPRNLKEESRIHQKAQKRWMWSALALGAASFADAGSSWGKMEANGLLRSSNGTFGAKGLGIKMGMVGGILLSQHVMVQRNAALANVLTYTNYGMAGLKTAVAFRNSQIEKPSYLLRQK
jgi:hypothetical protein